MQWHILKNNWIESQLMNEYKYVLIIRLLKM